MLKKWNRSWYAHKSNIFGPNLLLILVDNKRYNHFQFCRFLYPLSSISLSASIFMTVSITVERYWAVCRPTVKQNIYIIHIFNFCFHKILTCHIHSNYTIQNSNYSTGIPQCWTHSEQEYSSSKIFSSRHFCLRASECPKVFRNFGCIRRRNWRGKV